MWEEALAAYLVRRFGLMLLTLFGISVVIFLMLRVAPGNTASRRVMEKCGFQWTGVGLYRISALQSSAPVDRFRLDRGLWASLKSWGKVKRR